MKQTGRSQGIVRRALKRLMADGYVKLDGESYRQTDKWFNHFDGKRS
jgi:DNA-binding IclR family transcriptional regulator